MTYAVHNFLPVPERKNKYNFADMDVGDHMHIAGKTAKTLYQTVAKAGAKHGAKFTVRDWTEADDAKCSKEYDHSFGPGAMVWRVE